MNNNANHKVETISYSPRTGELYLRGENLTTGERFFNHVQVKYGVDCYDFTNAVVVETEKRATLRRNLERAGIEVDCPGDNKPVKMSQAALAW